MTQLVAFSGFATAGKDAAADALVDRLGFVKTYMSKPLEQALITLDPWVPEGVNAVEGWVRYSEYHKGLGYVETKKNDEVRRLLQALGTEIGRKMFGEDTWLDVATKEIQDLLRAGNRVTLTGVRYQNELARVRNMDGLTVWVDRPGVGAVNTHSSETSITREDCDMVVVNSGTLEDLALKLHKIFGYTQQFNAVEVKDDSCSFKIRDIGGGAFEHWCNTHEFCIIRPDEVSPESCPVAVEESA